MVVKVGHHPMGYHDGELDETLKAYDVVRLRDAAEEMVQSPVDNP